MIGQHCALGCGAMSIDDCRHIGDQDISFFLSGLDQGSVVGFVVLSRKLSYT